VLVRSDLVGDGCAHDDELLSIGHPVGDHPAAR